MKIWQMATTEAKVKVDDMKIWQMAASRSKSEGRFHENMTNGCRQKQKVKVDNMKLSQKGRNL
jgi:hypothetical protein